MVISYNCCRITVEFELPHFIAIPIGIKKINRYDLERKFQLLLYLIKSPNFRLKNSMKV